MSGATAALWALVALVLGGMATLVPPVFALLRERIEAERKRLAREAAFDAASVIEEQARKMPGMTGDAKLVAAVQLANRATSDRVTVTQDDVQAALPRVRASLPQPPSLPPLPIPVTVVDSERPETPTLPRPAPVPRDTSREKAPIR